METEKNTPTKEKTLNNSDSASAKKNVLDIQLAGDPDVWQVVCKASSKSEGWMKSTKAMEINGSGVLIQVTTQQKNPDGSYALAEALAFIPGAGIRATTSGTLTVV